MKKIQKERNDYINFVLPSETVTDDDGRILELAKSILLIRNKNLIREIQMMMRIAKRFLKGKKLIFSKL